MPLIQLLTTEQLSIDTGDEDSDFEVPLVHIKNRNKNKEVNEFTETLEEITCLNVSSDFDNAIVSEPGDIQTEILTIIDSHKTPISYPVRRISSDTLKENMKFTLMMMQLKFKSNIRKCCRITTLVLIVRKCSS
ncbi:hypothetical protein PoB_002347200 [Plakobranchus ocellatus]|uniref:Uncharacterized protein n=1 Tax=Plakobranchus ocellatus TaxID=259542 RepID=A0AAV3ZR36_9GAST|nr:hypothetical protein PoB_002347200 [Plakobranchus ocellatus]